MSFMLFLSVLVNVGLFIALLSAKAQAHYHQQRVFDMQQTLWRTTAPVAQGSSGIWLAILILGSLFWLFS